MSGIELRPNSSFLWIDIVDTEKHDSLGIYFTHSTMSYAGELFLGDNANNPNARFDDDDTAIELIREAFKLEDD